MSKSDCNKREFFLNRVFIGKKGIIRILHNQYKSAKEIVENVWGGIKPITGGSGSLFIILAALLYLIDRVSYFNGISIRRFLDNLLFINFDGYIGWFLNSLVLTMMIIYAIFYKPKIKEFISFFILAEIVSLIVFMGGAGLGVARFVILIIFYLFFFRNQYQSEQGPDNFSPNIIFSILLFIDYFGFGILAEYVNNPAISNRLIIPIWFYYALIYSHNRSQSWVSKFLIIIVVLMNVFYFAGGIEQMRNYQSSLTPEQKQEGVNFIQKGWQGIKGTYTKIMEDFQRDLDAQMEYATGGYYKGKVEKNNQGNLGVFIEDMKLSQSRYYSTKDVIVFGTIKAKSLKGRVYAKITCSKKGFAPTSHIETVPDKYFTIYNLETKDFECRIKPGHLISGTFTTPSFYGIFKSISLNAIGIHTLNVNVEFPFETLAYLPSYFMDAQRKRSMVREGLDPFAEFDIEDRNPTAVYTDGPVSIGMEVSSPIIEIEEGSLTQPRLGITFENRLGWDGKIKGITSIVILTPPEITIPGDGCTVDFNDYTLEDCKKDCVSNNDYYCKNICKNRNLRVDPDPAIDCEADCKPELIACENDCEILFRGEDSNQYNAYIFDNVYNIVSRAINPGTSIYYFKDIERFRSVSCRLNVKREVLGTGPITIKNFRAKVSYMYSLGKDIDVEIEAEPVEVIEGLTKSASSKVDIADPSSKLMVRLGTMPEYEIDPRIVMAIAIHESRYTHCCKPGTGGPPGVPGYRTCVKDDSRIECDETEVYTGAHGEIGMMQIMPSTAKDLCTDDDGNPFGTVAEAKKYLLNRDNNIKCAIQVLKSHYGKWGKDGYTGTKYAGCKTSIGKPFSEYREWDAALRAYNGWGCPDGDADYVEKIKANILKISTKSVEELYNTVSAPSKIIIQKKTNEVSIPEDIEEDELDVERKTKSEEVAEIVHNDYHSLIIRWALPEINPDKVKEYRVFRSSSANPLLEKNIAVVERDEALELASKDPAPYYIEDDPPAGDIIYKIVSVQEFAGEEKVSEAITKRLRVKPQPIKSLSFDSLNEKGIWQPITEYLHIGDEKKSKLVLSWDKPDSESGDKILITRVHPDNPDFNYYVWLDINKKGFTEGHPTLKPKIDSKEIKAGTYKYIVKAAAAINPLGLTVFGDHYKELKNKDYFIFSEPREVEVEFKGTKKDD